MKNIVAVISLASALVSVSAFAADNHQLGEGIQFKSGSHYKNLEQVTVDSPNLPVALPHHADLYAGSK